jgi:chloramphenicol-sensitive protein RarD
MYINPSMQFLIAVFVFKESISAVQLASFALIWLALALYSWSAWRVMQAGRSGAAVHGTDARND